MRAFKSLCLLGSFLEGPHKRYLSGISSSVLLGMSTKMKLMMDLCK